MSERLTQSHLIPVPVCNVREAVELYCQLFDGIRDETDDTIVYPVGDRMFGLQVVQCGSIVIRQKGYWENTRLEMWIDDIEPWLTRAEKVGCTVYSRLREEGPGQRIVLSEFRDRFGHLWMFCRDVTTPDDDE